MVPRAPAALLLFLPVLKPSATPQPLIPAIRQGAELAPLPMVGIWGWEGAAEPACWHGFGFAPLAQWSAPQFQHQLSVRVHHAHVQQAQRLLMVGWGNFKRTNTED